MLTKEIMQGVSKAEAKRFMETFNRVWAVNYNSFDTFTTAVAAALTAIGKPVDSIKGNTASSVVWRMERKAGVKQ